MVTGLDAYTYRRGVDFTGGEFSSHFYPTTTGVQQAAQHGHKIARLAVKWEYLQPTLGAALSSTELTKLTTSLDAFNAAGVGVVIEPHNYGRYKTADGVTHLLGDTDGVLTNTGFADFWTKLVTALVSHPAIYGWELMNEPHDLPARSGLTAARTWEIACQAAVTAIRAVDPNRMLWIPTYQWQSMYVDTNHPNGPWITNGGLLRYSAHQYLDWADGGTYGNTYASYNSSAVSAGFANLRASNAADLKRFTDWLTRYSVKGTVSEIGWPFDGTDLALWQGDGDAIYQKYDAAGLDVTYWSSGSYSSAANAEMTTAYNYSTNTTLAAVLPQASVIEAHPSVAPTGTTGTGTASLKASAALSATGVRGAPGSATVSLTGSATLTAIGSTPSPPTKPSGWQLNRYLGGVWVDAFTFTALPTSIIKSSFGYTTNGLVVSLNGSASTTSPGQTITVYSWDFGDGSGVGSGKTATHTYASPGTYSVALTVRDATGAGNTSTQTLTVKSVDLDYLADPNPHFNQFVHPASGTSVAQCILQSPDTGEWYMSQVHPETTASFTNTDSMRISRMAADGTLLDQMLCTYGGHGTSIGLEYTNGQMFIWATYYEPVAGTSRVHDIVRFPYTVGTFTRAQITGLQVKLAGGIYRRFQFDWRNGYFLLTEDPTWKRLRIVDVQSGVFTSPVNTITVTVNPPTLQGLATYGDSVFYYTGDGAGSVAQGATMPGGPFTLYEKSWKTGTQVNKVDLSHMLADASGNYTGGRVEPESCTLYDPAPGSNPILNIGLISGPAGTAHTYYVYGFDLINQSDVVAGRTFALRATKPSPANVGAGILRPVTAVHNGDLTITQNNFLLADTTVNGKVVVQAANVVIENCFINGPVTDPGSTTVNPIWIVNTDNAAVVNGPALVRYSTITGNWKSPNLYGVGNRNYTLEYCDISKVVEGARATAAATGGDASTLIRGNYIHDLIFYCPDPTNPTNVGATNIAGNALTGTWAGKNWNWSSGVHLLNNASTGIEIYGNNIVANWSTDPAASTLPVPPAYARLNALRITAGTNIPVEDNWLDGGEYCLYSPTAATSGNIARNRFGRTMAHASSTDNSYYALLVAGTAFNTNGNGPDRNVWVDTGATVFPRAS